MVNYKIANDIIAIRKSLKMNQTEFGKMIGVNQKMVSHLESGKAGYTLKLLEKIADLTGAGLEVSLKFRQKKLKKEENLNSEVTPEEREEIRNNIKWFSRLDPVQKIRAVELNNRATRKMLNGS